MVSPSPRVFARVLKRTHNPAHATTGGQRSALGMCQHAQKGQNQWELEALHLVREVGGRLCDRVRVAGRTEVHNEGVYYLE